MIESNGELVSYRLQRARETLADARILAEAFVQNLADLIEKC